MPVVEAVGGPAVFIGFAGVCALSVLFVKAQVVETKGKSLKEVQMMFQNLGPRGLLGPRALEPQEGQRLIGDGATKSSNSI